MAGFRGSWHCIALYYIDKEWVYPTREGCFISEYQNAVNQTFLATDNRSGRNPLRSFCVIAGMYEPRGEGSDKGRNQDQPWSCVGQCADSPSYPVARASTFGRKSLWIPPTAFPRLLLRPLQVSFPIPFLPPRRPFSLSLPRCRLLLLFVQDSGWS